MKPSEVMPWNSGGGGTSFDWLEKIKPHQFDEADAEPEGDEKLVLMRTVIEVTDDDPLHHARPTIMTNSEPAITATMNEPVYWKAT